MSKQLVVVGDADALIAQLHRHDKNHQKAKELGKTLEKREALVSFPVTAVSEAITVLKYKKVNPGAVERLVAYSISGKIAVDEVDFEVFQKASSLFDVKDSKRNTYFDALVAAVALQKKADAVFSFDSWYAKKGFTLAGDVD